ncbi:MAG: response regulator transcription factor, partial [Bradyrhizobium sp.]
GHQENRISDSPFSSWIESSAPPDNDLENARLSAARTRGMEEAGSALARQLNGPMTALLLYMGEIKQHSQQLSQAAPNRIYLQQVVENALQQTERVCAMIKQLADSHEPVAESGKALLDKRVAGKDGAGIPGVMLSSGVDQKPLTRREREVLNLISEGYSNKQGALRMGISPRTFESHRAEAMRKLGARNTADLVRLALLHSPV